MRFLLLALLPILSAGAVAATERLHTVCQIFVDEQGQSVLQEGKCNIRQSPASTFKVALALMGFDSGELQDANHPKWPFKKGYDSYLAEWKQETDPARWMRHSVLWYSKQLALKLGEDRTAAYLKALNYGNQNMRGHKGAVPLTSFWLGSSLQISPIEQAELMRKMMMGHLSLSQHSVQETITLMDHGAAQNGWRIYGKTGSGRERDGKGQAKQNFGWFVGFATKGDQRLAFARLIQSPVKEVKSLGLLARDQLIDTYFTKPLSFKSN